MNVSVTRIDLDTTVEPIKLTTVAEPIALTLTQGPITLGGAQPYEHVQAIPEAVWSIEHNLGRMPSVTVTTSAGDVVVGHVNHTDTNELTITVSAAFAGRAYLV